MLMRLPTTFAEKIISGEVKPESSIPYTGIHPGSTGHDGRHYGCDCLPEREKRISNAALSLYTLIITECIEESSLNAQQMAELQNFWYQCVSLQEQGLLTDTYFILFIVFLVLFILVLAGLVVYCIIINYNKKKQEYEGVESEYIGRPLEPRRERVPVSNASKKIQGYNNKWGIHRK
jgi:hypothetical protein